jgi:hypothetical protein
MNTPLLLMAWRRPHTLLQLINAIRPVAPSQLFVACDGPRLDIAGELEKVESTRTIIELAIDWPCKLHRLYSPTNLGCRLGPITAINWFFEHVEEGIILEDDCVPHPDFFSFCTTLLERYRMDSRVWCISGDNFQDGRWTGDGSYYFSRYSHVWGWATWRHCWQHYDSDLAQWPVLRDSDFLDVIFENPLERRYWLEIWERTYLQNVPITWWDYQWSFTCLVNSGLTALPNRNLVSNVGFGPDGVHTTATAEPTRADSPLGTIKHPEFIVRDTLADRYTFDNHFGGLHFKTARRLESRLKTLILRLLCKHQILSR